MSASAIAIIGLHTAVAWVLVEVYVNTFHHLSRWRYVLFHYLTIVAAFGLVFAAHTRWFGGSMSPFATTVTAMGFVLFLEVVVFYYVYIGERWFLNFVDWILPMFLAASSVYAARYFW